jgi:hypothetical protein
LREMAARVRAIPVDSKARMLLERVKTILDADPTEKVLVFTQFRETQTYLKELFENEGYQVALFHGEYGSAGYNKTAEFERFKKNPAVRIMLSTDVGGEGLNFQFCRVLFNYDLPWNPMRIEQRIGRLDRIGQERDVQIYNFFLQDTLDARILTVLQDRIRIFEETIGNLDPILGDDIERDIQEMVLVDEKTAQRKLAEFEQQAERRVREAREAETMLADFIMDARSFRRDIVDEILGRKPPVSNRDIEAFTCAFLGRYPSAALKMEEDNIITITVPAAFREDCRKLYGIHLEDQYRGTFDPQTAIKEDTVDFFAFGHLLVEAIIQYCTEHERNDRFKPQTAIRILHDPSLASYKGIQFNYVLCFDGVRAYKKLIPLVLDMQGDYDETVSGKIASLPTDEETEKVHRADISSSSVHRLQECSLEIIGQIAGKEKEAVQERNRKDYDDAQEKLTRLSEYHLRYQQDQLEQRQARLEDAR